MSTTDTEDPRVVRSRAIILAAATDHFVSRGFVGANVDVLAAEAGVSKRTVYNLYGGKEKLFRAVLDEAIETAERFTSDLAAGLAVGSDLDGDLERIAVRLSDAVLGGRIVPLRRLLIGEGDRFPEIARDYYQRAPGLVMDTLAGLIARLADEGRLDVDDPATAAEHFAFLAMGAPLDRALFGAGRSRASNVARAKAGAAAFLRAYRAQPPE